MRRQLSTPEALFAASTGFLDHHTSCFELLSGASDDFIDYPASVMKVHTRALVEKP